MKNKCIDNPIEEKEFRKLVKFYQCSSSNLIAGCLDENGIAWKEAVLHRVCMAMDDLVKIQAYITYTNIKDPSKKSLFAKIVSFFKFKGEQNG